MAVYKSGYAALQVLVRPEIPFYHPITGVETNRVPRLIVDFGVHGPEFNAPNPLTGEIELHSSIFGHYYDTDVAAEKEDWSPEERASVETVLDKLCREQPYLIAKVDMTPQPAALPWPTYDQTPVAQIVKLATSLGLAEQVIAYEREHDARDKVIAELEDWLSDNPQPVEETVGMITL